ncbi:hypothetical protein [Micromonospora sp. AKA38]|uniref:hypothetical protein n=1 Tax=Micromonospora sp. AKA38 TaxID=2733861 RepID=UPI002491B704|nr:hypothetical protein [Micromonospora sp. AKA38]
MQMVVTKVPTTKSSPRSMSDGGIGTYRPEPKTVSLSVSGLSQISRLIRSPAGSASGTSSGTGDFADADEGGQGKG